MVVKCQEEKKGKRNMKKKHGEHNQTTGGEEYQTIYRPNVNLPTLLAH